MVILQYKKGGEGMYDPDEKCKAMIASLKKLCRQKNITPHALAKEAGISTSTMSYLMNGRTRPQVYTILMICNVLGVQISELFDSENSSLSEKYPQTANGYRTSEERELLDCYRHLSAKKRELLRVYVEMLLQYNEKIPWEDAGNPLT